LRVLVVDGSRAMRMISGRTLHTVAADRPKAARTPLRSAAAVSRLHAHSSPTPLAVPASARVVTRPTLAGLRWFARTDVSTGALQRFRLAVLRAVV
jgi:hypothetical protein